MSFINAHAELVSFLGGMIDVIKYEIIKVSRDLENINLFNRNFYLRIHIAEDVVRYRGIGLNDAFSFNFIFNKYIRDDVN